MSYHNKWEAKGIYRKFTGIVSGQEVLLSNYAIQGDPRFDDIRYVINDFTEIVDFEVSTRDIDTIAAVDNAASISNPNIKVAIVATLEPLLLWAKRYCANMQGSPYECELFNSIDDAAKWVCGR